MEEEEEGMKRRGNNGNPHRLAMPLEELLEIQNPVRFT